MKSCTEKTKIYVDKSQEYRVIIDNRQGNTSEFELFQKFNSSIGLYKLPVASLEMCSFSNIFNPVLLDSQLTNWRGIKYLLFINPFFVSTLLVINLIRVLLIIYMNRNSGERIAQRRKKEIYETFGRSFTSASVIAITEVLTILYYIFW